MTPLIVLVALAAHANPISCEQPGDIVLADDGRHVVATMLEMCEGADILNENFIVQVDDGGWETLNGKWKEAGTEQAEGGSGVETYDRFEQEVSCPADGSYEFRIAYIEGPEGWSSATVDCEGRGACSVVPVSTGLGALALSLGLIAARRRR